MFLHTSLYAALLALVYIVLTARVVRLRKRSRIALGDGSDLCLQRAIRAHANFIEYVPFGLILLMMLENTQRFSAVVGVLGFTLLIGRVFHAFGVSQIHENIKIRIIGMVMTLIVLGTLSVLLLINFLFF